MGWRMDLGPRYLAWVDFLMFFLGFGLAFVAIMAWADADVESREVPDQIWEDRLERSTPGVADKSLTAAVSTALKLSPHLAGYPIEVTTFNKVVTLSGSVRTEPEITQAVNAAINTPGVEKVISRLRADENVRPTPSEETGEPVADVTPRNPKH